MPESVVARAKVCLQELASVPGAAAAAAPPAAGDAQLTIGSAAEDEVLERLRGARLDSLSPIEAMNLLYELQRKLEP